VKLILETLKAILGKAGRYFQIWSNCNINGRNQTFQVVPMSKDVILARLQVCCQ
jgi:hypothetical protein